MNSFKDRIIAEMVVDHSNALEKNFELAKSLFNITAKGKVDILNKDKYLAKEQIILYLIGKLYAKEAELSSERGADRTELMNELGLPVGTVDPYLKKLSDERLIEKDKAAQKTQYVVSSNRVEKLLKTIAGPR